MNEQGRTAEAWQVLSFRGDRYADNAAAVTGIPSAGTLGHEMNTFVRLHWYQIAGKSAYDEKFSTVAKAHLNNYLNILSQNPDWPTSRDIESSYRTVVELNGLPTKVAIDGVITRSIGEVSSKVDWPFWLNIEQSRIVPSSVFSDIPIDEAWTELIKTLLMTKLAHSPFGLESIFFPPHMAFLNFLMWAPPRTDPLALDLDNDGIETIGIGSTVVVFDHNADGIKTGTGWVKADDGFLVLDRNGNGMIDSGRELFGVDTLKANGNLATNGFDALSDLDSNGDHLFSQADTQFGQVKVWRDLNQNGVSSPNELFTLPQLGIVSINLNATSQNVNLGNGNVQTASAAHLTVDGTGQTGNLDLANDPFYREFSDTITPTAQALTLPDTQGSGFVRDLREAVSLSPAVATVLTNYVNQINYADQQALLDDLLSAWANTSTLKTSIEQADQKGYFLIYLPPGQTQASYDQHMAYWNTSDANILNTLTPEKRASYELLQHQQQEFNAMISVLERFNGTPYVTVATDRVTLGNGTQVMVSAVPGVQNSERVYLSLFSQQIELMQQSYEALKESVHSSLVLQTRLAPYLNEIALDVDASSQVFVNFAAMNALLESNKAINPANALADLIELNKYAGTTLQSNGWTGLDMLRNWIDQRIAGTQTEVVLHDLNVSVIEQGSADKILFSAISNNTINGSDSNDILNGNIGNDTIYAGAGNDVVNGSAGTDYISAGDGADIIHGEMGDDRLYGGSGDDILQGNEQNDQLYGGLGDDKLEGNDHDDYLAGDEGNDILEGGRGNDSINGGIGNDIYLFGRGDGQDSINFDPDPAIGKLNTLQFKAGILPSDITFNMAGSSLVIKIAGTVDQITVSNFITNGTTDSLENPLQQIKFDNGIIWNTAQIIARLYGGTEGNDSLSGTSNDDVMAGLGGNDYLLSEAGNDVLDGGRGNDVIDGGTGSDIYLFGKGDGGDFVRFSAPDSTTGKTDILRFKAGVSPSEILLSSGAAYLNINVLGTNDAITVQHFLYQDNPNNTYNPLQQIEFSDGTVWNLNGILNKLFSGTNYSETIEGTFGDDLINGQGGYDRLFGKNGNDKIYGGEGRDDVYGEDGNDILDGGIGDDNLNGGNGDDSLWGGIGSDSLYGGAGNDILDGGTGYDYMYGGEGADIYRFGAGYEYDRVIGANSSINGLDRVELFDFLNTELSYSRSDESLLISSKVNRNDTLTIDNFFSTGTSASTVKSVQFEDGTIWNNEIFFQKVLLGDETSQTITGYSSDDVINAASGNDTVYGMAGNDTLNGENDSDTLYGGDGNDVVRGGAGNDSLYGDAGDDVIDGGAGNDYLYGGYGTDIFRYGKGYGADVIRSSDALANCTDIIQLFDLDAASIRFSRNNEALVLTRKSDTTDNLTIDYYFKDSDPVSTVKSIQFMDGTPWDEGAIRQAVLMGDETSQVITGYLTADIVNAEAGNDTIYGMSGNDSLDGGSDSDIVYGGDGNDVVRGGNGNDSLYGDVGDDVIDGGEGQDSLYGGAGNDVLNGGLGAGDVLMGNAGNDVYLFAVGDGNTTINNYDTSTGHYDVLRFAAGISPSGVIASHSGDYLLLTLQSTGEVITVQNQFYNSQYALSAIEFSDGTIWNNAILTSMVLTGTASADSLLGFATDDTINGLGGNDNIYGFGGNDTLDGGAGNDYLSGGDGNDTLIGGEGQDSLYGGAGNDFFIINSVSHIDSISDYNVANDTIQLINAVFTALTTGTLEASQFIIGVQAQDNNDFVIYNNTTGALFYDADGNGAGAAVQIASLSTGLAMTNLDFVVI